jgi:hypothetical protein
MLHRSNPDFGSPPAPLTRNHREEESMDWSPRFEPETKSVRFYVLVRGARVKSFVTRDWLASRFGPEIPADDRMVDVYLQNANTIEAEIMRRIASGRMEPVWLALAHPPLG